MEWVWKKMNMCSRKFYPLTYQYFSLFLSCLDSQFAVKPWPTCLLYWWEKTKTLLWLELTTMSSEVLHFVIEPWNLLLSLVKPHGTFLDKHILWPDGTLPSYMAMHNLIKLQVMAEFLSIQKFLPLYQDPAQENLQYLANLCCHAALKISII